MTTGRGSSNSMNRFIGLAVSWAVCLPICAWPSGAAAAESAAKAGGGPAGAYKVQRTFKTGLDGKWDFLTVDSEGRRLFLSLGDRSLVLNADDGAKIGEVPDTRGIHGIALVPDVGRGFTSNGGANTLTVFDLKTLKTLMTIPAPGDPDFIFHDPGSQRVWAFGNKGKVATAVKADTQGDPKDVATLDLPGAPEAAATDGEGTIYVNLEDKSEVVRIDSKGLKVTAEWPVDPGKTPTGLALDKQHARLFCSCRNEKMILLDAATGKVLDTAPIGSGTDTAVFDPKTGLAFSSNRDGTLTVLREEPAGKLTVVQNVETAEGAKTMALDPTTGLIYLPTAEFGPPTPATEAEGKAGEKAAGKGAGKGAGKAGEKGKARPSVIPGSFVVLVVGKS